MAAGFRDVLASAGIRPGGGLDVHASGSVSFSFVPLSGNLVDRNAITGSVSLSFGGTYALTGAGPLSATIPLTTTVYGAFLGAGDIAGSVSVSLTPSGTLLALGVLTSSTSMSLAVSPTISGAVGYFANPGFWPVGIGYPNPQALNSVVAVTSTVTGAITGLAPLVSTVGFSFNVEGRQPPGILSLLWGSGLAIGVDAGLMQGSVSMSLTAAWAGNSVFGYMNGAVTTSINVAAVPETSISALQGRFRAPLMHPGRGPWNPTTFKRRRVNVKARELGSLTGTVPLTLSSFGSFATSSGSLVSAPTTVFGVSGTLSDAGTATSVVPMLFDTTGALTGVGVLVSNVTLVFDVTGTIRDPGAVDGVVPSSFTVDGNLLGAGALVGSVVIQTGLAGSFPSVWRPIPKRRRTIWTPIRTR